MCVEMTHNSCTRNTNNIPTTTATITTTTTTSKCNNVTLLLSKYVMTHYCSCSRMSNTKKMDVDTFSVLMITYRFFSIYFFYYYFFRFFILFYFYFFLLILFIACHMRVHIAPISHVNIHNNKVYAFLSLNFN